MIFQNSTPFSSSAGAGEKLVHRSKIIRISNYGVAYAAGPKNDQAVGFSFEKVKQARPDHPLKLSMRVGREVDLEYDSRGRLIAVILVDEAAKTQEQKSVPSEKRQIGRFLRRWAGLRFLFAANSPSMRHSSLFP